MILSAVASLCRKELKYKGWGGYVGFLPQGVVFLVLSVNS